MTPTRLCATVGARTIDELVARRDAAAEAGADLVELRLDALDRPEVEPALRARRTPVIVTCRAAWEGGMYGGPEAERLALLERAWTHGADLVDVEWRADGRPALVERTGGRRIVVSLHRFTAGADVAAEFSRMCASPAEVVKVAVATARLDEAARLLQLRDRANGKPFVAIAMGTAGIATRILASRVGSAWTYAGDAWAPGQVPLGQMLEQYRFRHIGPTTAVYGVVGRPIGHSLSPVMHNAAFAAAGRDAVYLPFEAADAEDFLAAAACWQVRGASVTAPFKEALAAAAQLDDLAHRVGALNTLVRTSDGWVGTNTDVHGFLAPLAARVALRGTRVTVLGAGGAARAAAVALASAGARVTVCARRREQGDAVARVAGTEVADWPPARGSWDVLVNTTPVGTAPRLDDTPWPDATFDGSLVYDLVYNPRETRLLRDAATAGCDTLGGLEMLVAQAARQFELWTGHAPDTGVMRRAADAALDARSLPA